MYIKHPLKARHPPRCFTYQISSQHPCRIHIIIPIFQLRNWGSGNLNNLTNFTYLSIRARIPDHFQSLSTALGKEELGSELNSPISQLWSDLFLTLSSLLIFEV